MPKDANTPEQWEEALKSFAATGKVARGGAPGKGTVQRSKYDRIRNCPLLPVGGKVVKGQKTLFNLPVLCSCGYHRKKDPTPEPSQPEGGKPETPPRPRSTQALDYISSLIDIPQATTSKDSGPQSSSAKKRRVDLPHTVTSDSPTSSLPPPPPPLHLRSTQVQSSGSDMAASAESGLQVSDSEKEFLECGLCYENDDLKRLPCSPVHIYCVPCLTRDSADTNIVQCPACRKVFDGGVNAIPSVSVTLDRMMCCDVCMRKEEKLKLAQMYCVICQKRFCDLHMKSHNDALDELRRIPMSEYQREYRRLEIRYCAEHSDQVYSAACTKCYHVFCAQCMIEPTKCPNASTHSLASLSKMVAEMSDSINQKKVWIFDKEEALLGIIKQVNGNISKWDEETRKMISEIHQTRDKHLEEIRVRYAELEKPLVEMRSQGKEELNKFVGEDFDRKLNLISRGVKKLDFRLLAQHSVDIVKGFKDTEKLVQELMSIKVPNLPRPSGDVKLAPKDLAHDVALEVVDEITLPTTSTVPIPTSMRLTEEIMVCDHPMAVFHHKTYTYIGLNGKLLRVPDGQVTADLSSVESIDGCIVHQNELFVLEESSVQVKTMDLTAIRSWATNFFLMSFNKIRSVDNRLVIPNTEVTKLDVYDMNGTLLKQVPCSFCRGTLAMSSVGDNTVIISRCNPNTVARVNIDTGKVMWTSKQVQRPEGVVCYKEKYVLVTNKNNCSRIWILDVETGELLGELSDKVNEGYMEASSAYDMHIYGDTLIIPKHDSKYVQYYQLS